MRITTLIISVILTIQLTGCATNAMTGRSQLSLVSESAAINKSSALYDAMIESYNKNNKVLTDQAVNDRVQIITNRLVERAILYRPDSQKWHWQVNVIENDVINAACMPGGKMVVYTGLLDKVQPTDDELAQVMGHEISHALANHGAEKMSVQILSQIAVATVAVAAAASDRSSNPRQRNQNSQAVQSAGALAAAAFITLPNSRGAETEADKLGIELAAQAGYDPAAAISLWKKMADATDSKSRGDFLSTHPSPPKRIEALETLQEPMNKIYSERKAEYANYAPSYQYVRAGPDAAGFTSSNVRVVKEGEGQALVEPPAVDTTKALAFYSPEFEAFKAGTFEMPCKDCGLKFYLNQSEFKKLQEKQDWRGLAQSLIKIGYQFDLSYYYLGLAAQGLGFTDASNHYFKRAHELAETEEFSCAKAKLNKCADKDIAAIVNQN